MDEDHLKNVRQQYEDFPYPPRNAEEERTRLLEVDIDRLPAVNFYCFRGQKDFTGARLLVAGGGTGDSAIYLAEQLRPLNGEVVYLDISAASMQVAKERAAVRRLDNIVWKHGSILSLTPERDGRFDYISCTGVLHHLENPELGLRKLTSVLKPGGAMGVMVYAKYGRTGVYQLQQLMRLINSREADMGAKIANTRRMLEALPQSNWFRHNEQFLSDHKKLGDAGLVDLLLHEQDVAYSIDEIHALLAQADLHFAEFNDVRMRMSYRPEQYLRDPALLHTIAQLDRVTQQGIAELIVGLFRQHSFYASTERGTRAALGALTDVPFFFPPHAYKNYGSELAKVMRQRPNQMLPLRHLSGFEFDVPSDSLGAAIFDNIDGKRDWREIFARARKQAPEITASDEDLLERFRPTFEQFNQFDWLLLRGGASPAIRDTVELHADGQARRR